MLLHLLAGAKDACAGTRWDEVHLQLKVQESMLAVKSAHSDLGRGTSMLLRLLAGAEDTCAGTGWDEVPVQLKVQESTQTSRQTQQSAPDQP